MPWRHTAQIVLCMGAVARSLGHGLLQAVGCLVSEVGLETAITTEVHADALRTVEIALTLTSDKQQSIIKTRLVLACGPAAIAFEKEFDAYPT